ncbi:MAG: hypothetical protein P1T08_18325 [Acidimicrobiia bacterium]|nr:hypothetical protein [Acidimicrobiia bacterium]
MLLRGSAIIVLTALLTTACGRVESGSVSTGVVDQPVALDTTTSSVPATTSSLAITTSTTSPTTPEGYPADESGRRLVVATDASTTYVCGFVIFPDSKPPEAITEPTVDVDGLLAGAGPPGVDQDSFYEIYDWVVVSETAKTVTLLGYPKHPDWPDLYPGQYGFVAFVHRDDQWEALSSAWCDPTVSQLDAPTGASSTIPLWPDEYLQAVIGRDWTTINNYVLDETWSGLLLPPNPADWKLDHLAGPDPTSTRLPILIHERNCASGQVPSDRDIDVLVTETEGGLALTVLVASSGGLCPENPWYPITVVLPTPLGDTRLFDGRTLPVAPRN